MKIGRAIFIAFLVQTVASRGHHRLMQTSSVSNLRSFQQRSISATQLTNEETLSTVQDFGQQSEHDNDNQIKKEVSPIKYQLIKEYLYWKQGWTMDVDVTGIQ